MLQCWGKTCLPFSNVQQKKKTARPLIQQFRQHAKIHSADKLKLGAEQTVDISSNLRHSNAFSLRHGGGRLIEPWRTFPMYHPPIQNYFSGSPVNCFTQQRKTQIFNFASKDRAVVNQVESTIAKQLRTKGRKKKRKKPIMTQSCGNEKSFFGVTQGYHPKVYRSADDRRIQWAKPFYT